MDLNELVVDQIINSEREKISSDYDRKLKKAVEKEKLEISVKHDKKVELYQSQLEEKNNSILELLDVKEENEKLKRDYDIAEQEMKIKIEKEKRKIIKTVSIDLEEKISEKFQFELEQKNNEIAEKNKKIEQITKSAKEAVKKARQGSMQIQGEIQEEAIEKWLLDQFPLDEILEVKKGQLGADCLQIVNEFETQNCGRIYYESKNTKEFNMGWIKKFKKDIESQNADIGVLVTEALPKNMSRMGVLEGIYICSFREFKGLCHILRKSLVDLTRHRIINENVGEKKQVLYNYLTSKKFVSQVETIIDSFIQMNSNLDKEQIAATAYFEKRRANIRMAQNATVGLFSNFSTIAGSSIRDIELIKLDPDSKHSNVELLQRLTEKG